MGRQLSRDLRDRVLNASGDGLPARKRAERFGVAASIAIRWIDRAAKGRPARGRAQHGHRVCGSTPTSSMA